MANLIKGERLTRQERRVCDLVCQGKSNKEIAREMKISHRTVEEYRQAAVKKMGAPNAVALVHKVLSARIAELEAALAVG
jgi:two-component system nitrate/nitrite response regulator NarL